MPLSSVRRRQVAATCQVALPASAGAAPAPSPSGLQGADADCYNRAMAAMNSGGACYEATPTSCADACKAELQSFTVTDACWVAILSDPLVGAVLGEDHL